MSESEQRSSVERDQTFRAERITNPEDPRVDPVQAFLQAQFKSQEVDPVEVMRTAIGAVLELKNEDYERIEDKAIIQGSYIAAVKKYRRLGVGSKAFEFRMAEAMEDAKRRGLEIVAYVGEVFDDSEAFINSQGASRLYIREGNDQYKEVPYYQPPLDWNLETGRPAEGARTVPEHLMVRTMDGSKTISGEQLLEMVRVIYDYNNYREREAFKNARAYRTHTGIIGNIEEELTETVSGKDLMMISREERESMKAQGITFVEHGLAV